MKSSWLSITAASTVCVPREVVCRSRGRLMADDPQRVDSETFKRLLDVEMARWASLLDRLAVND